MGPWQSFRHVPTPFAAALVTGVLAVATTAPGAAATLDGLRDAGLDALYGQYAPGGDCRREPRISAGAEGLDFVVGGRSTYAARVELAASYAGPDYDGIGRWIFPFPVSDDDPGRVLMTFNPDEKPGTLAIESNLGPGQRMSALQAALVAASPYARCGAPPGA